MKEKKNYLENLTSPNLNKPVYYNKIQMFIYHSFCWSKYENLCRKLCF